MMILVVAVADGIKVDADADDRCQNSKTMIWRARKGHCICDAVEGRAIDVDADIINCLGRE